MADAILVPQVGQDLTEAKIVALHVKLGDQVKRGDIVAEVESEKANFEVEAFTSGIVIELSYREGDVATVLEPLMVLGEPGEAKAETPVESHVASKQASIPIAGNQPALIHEAAGGSSRSSPLARRIAQENNVEIAKVSGTGPGKAVVLRDVEAWIARAPKPVAGAVGLRPSAGATGAVRGLKPGEGVPALYLHGFGADISIWRALVGRLKTANPALGIDLPGHGGAEGNAASFAELADAVGAALVAAGQTSLHIVAHSLGAAVALALSARGDLDVKSLTLIAPAGLGVGIDGSFVSGFLEAKSEAALAAWMGRLVHDPATLPDTMVRATLTARETPGLVDRQAAISRAVFEGSTQLFSVVHELRAFDRPCRIILGRKDAIVSSTETAAVVPGHVALHRLENVGHLPFVESPALVARLIDETIRSAT